VSNVASADPFCLSTAWAPWAWPTLKKSVSAGVKLGFRRFELGVVGGRFRLRKAIALAERLGISYCSVHNVCCEGRVPPANRRGDWLSSCDEEQRREGVHATLKTAAVARELGVGAIVLHLGHTGYHAPISRQQLIRKVQAGEGAEVHRLLAQRNQAAAAPLDAACRSLEELCSQVSDLALCIETPYHWCDMPLPAELDAVFSRVQAANLRYWHDFGHGHANELLDIAKQTDWLHRFRDKLYGVHLHDAVGLRDHRPPGYGEIDFPSLLPIVPRAALKVIELSSEFNIDELHSGLRFCQQLLPEQEA